MTNEHWLCWAITRHLRDRGFSVNMNGVRLGNAVIDGKVVGNQWRMALDSGHDMWSHCATEYCRDFGASLPQPATSVCVARTSNCSSTFYHPPLANLEIVPVSFRVLLVIILRQRAPVNVQT